ncbi:MAG: hypothetical protein IV090_23380 [Candidatus Sericytochromatia bacterium]|nr:hypothetical protein [Candidatus Sericytochromatia bacterium]
MKRLYVALFFSFVLPLSACQPLVLPLNQTQTPLEASLQDFLLQSVRGQSDRDAQRSKDKRREDEKHKKPPKLAERDWKDFKPRSRCERTPELLITDILLTETGEKVMGPNAPAALRPDYAGTEIRLTIQGQFEKRNEKAFKLKEFLFQLEPPLVQQSFVGNEPQARVLLDDSILLQVESVTATEIKARLNTKLLPDLYLKGNHRLSIELNRWYTDALLNVGEPAPVELSALQPQIESVEVLRERGKPMHIKLTGKGFMVFPKFSYATIDGEFGFGYQTEVTADGAAETVVHIPDPASFDLNPRHTVIYATPFGVTFKEFES